MSPLELYLLLFSLLFALLLFCAILIYKVFGWIPCFIYSLLLVFGPVVIYQPYEYKYNAVAGGFKVAHAFFCFACILIFTWRAFVIDAHRDEYNKFYNDRLGEPTDEDLLKVKRTFGYLPGPGYEKMNGYREREFLTEEWRKKRRAQLELRDPFLWICEHYKSSDMESDDDLDDYSDDYPDDYPDNYPDGYSDDYSGDDYPDDCLEDYSDDDDPDDCLEDYSDDDDIE